MGLPYVMVKTGKSVSVHEQNMWENPASTQSYKYLETPILIIYFVASQEGMELHA